MRALVEKYNSLNETQKKRGLIAILMVLALIGVWLSGQDEAESVGPLIPIESSVPVSPGIFVHVVGEVALPGLYQLPVGSRASDAIDRAGGLSSEAAQESINLARILSDGEQLTVLSREAIDSNDASLVVLIESENFSILFLGDLGQSGQERLLRRHPRLLSQLAAKTLVTKVAHHGSADQSANLYRATDSEILIFSVGKNDYGHPTNSALGLAWPSGAKVLRTDLLGHVALSFTSELRYRYSGKLTA